MPTRLLIEGRPGVGKTTAIRRLAALLPARDVSGFTTEEIRLGGTRVGFALETFTGDHAVLAHVDFPGPPRVGRYGVDLDVMERLALPTLEAAVRDASAGQLVLVDELGRMELACSPFREGVRSLFAADVDVVATVHAHHDPFTDALKRRTDVELLQITPANRDAVPEELATRFRSG
ncbi:nucleoside-triphosphatase [Streptomyces sp. NPDC048506]|uniref:nucleoside-triphosphatase n=1 Tax=Streptomyces sp. NPDC048506 TaxID=3155028 RepID=UPI003437E84A